MNQQRSRRFRTAKEAKELREKAERKGEVVEEGGFDSNCITPGILLSVYSLCSSYLGLRYSIHDSPL